MPISDEQLDRRFFHAVEALAKLQTTESIALAGLLVQLPTSRSPTRLPHPFLVSIASPAFHFDPEEAYRLGRITHSLILQTTLLLGNVALTEFETPEEDSPKNAGKKTDYIVPDSQVQKETDLTDHRDAAVYGHVLWLLSWKLDRGLQENGWSLEFDEKEKLVDLSLSALRLLCTSPELQLKMKDMDVVERLYIGKTLRWPASYEVYLSQLFLKISTTWTLEGILSAMPVIHITLLQQLFDNGAKKMKDERRESATWERLNSQVDLTELKDDESLTFSKIAISWCINKTRTYISHSTETDQTVFILVLDGKLAVFLASTKALRIKVALGPRITSILSTRIYHSVRTHAKTTIVFRLHSQSIATFPWINPTSDGLCEAKFDVDDELETVSQRLVRAGLVATRKISLIEML